MLPWIALPLQRRFVGWLTRHHQLLNRASGILLIAVGVFGIITELLPNYLPQIEIAPQSWTIYWLVVVGIIAAVVAVSYRRIQRDQRRTTIMVRHCYARKLLAMYT